MKHPERELVVKALTYVDEIRAIDRRLSEWTEAEKHCYVLSEEVKRLRRLSVLR